MLLPIFTLVLAIAIFAADTLTNADIAAPVLYVAVVLISVRFCERRGVLLVALGCVALTVFSFFLTRAGITRTASINTAISLSAVGLTTYLSLKIESVRSAAKVLTEADQLRDALIGSVAHELRSPLTAILGGVSILIETSTIAKDSRLASLTRGIRDEAVRLNNDIQNLLDAARISSKGLQARRDWIDPTDIIVAVTERVGRRFPDYTIEANCDRELPFIHVDAVLVEQALGQIIANSAKFSAPASKILVKAGIEGHQLVISVVDAGAGLTIEEKNRFTERFFRGERHVGKIPGSGLGLWIANTFIMSCGGKLDARSPGEGQGTTIRILFPNIRYIDDDLDSSGASTGG